MQQQLLLAILELLEQRRVLRIKRHRPSINKQKLRVGSCFEQIAVGDNQIRHLAGFDGTKFVTDAQNLRWPQRH